ncbi:MAG: branched-chain amino acid ABC transporter substrate-binding protein [Angustibacter sp.]
MRQTLRIGIPALIAAMALAACGGTTDSDTPATSTTTSVEIGFFGALTGDSANLGQNIKKGAQLAVDQYNAGSPKIKVTLREFDSQGDPAQAPALAKKAIDNKALIGMVGPAFSGESKAVNGSFAEAGLTTITPSATNPALADNGWKTFFRVLGNDNTQGPAAAKYITDVLKAEKVFILDDGQEYSVGLASIVKSTLGAKAVASDKVTPKSTDFSAVITKIKASGATAVFYGGYYAEAGLIRKQLSDAGVQVTMISGDGVKDEGFVTAATAQAAEGTVLMCPCLPADKAGGTFFADYKAAYKTEPATYSAEGFDSAKILLDAVAAGKTTRSDVLSFVGTYDKPGVTKQLKFTPKGESAEVAVWSYLVKGGKIVPDQEIKQS